MKLFPILLLPFFILQTSAQRDAGLTVNTQQGPVIGTLATPTVRRFLGIPFATAKRWQAPRLPPVRRAAFIANKFGDSCFQDLNPPNVEYLKLSNTQGINVSESEDCMSINIWTPSIGRKQKTAVMVWIYGGAFTFGTSNVPMFDGQNIVRDNDDLTLVTFNYRLNIFGQPNAPQLGSNNLNFGLLDVEAAVNWVYANIAEFGGDPERIGIFGQSAGAAAADAYAFAHPRDTIVKGAITGFSGLFITPPMTFTAWNTVAAAVGCGSTPTSQQFSCMQGMPAKTLEAAVISTNAAFTLVADNITVFADVNIRAANGNFLHVPMMGGTTMNENDIFAVAGELVTTGFAKPVITEIISDIQTLGQTCAAGAAAVFRINVNVPTWRYQYQAIFPGVSTRQDLRAFHSSEIQMVFGTFSISSPNPSSTQIALSRYVQSAWVAFARNPTQGLIDFGWPLYNPNTTSLAQLGGITNQTGVAFAKGSDIDAPCADQATLLPMLNQLSNLLTV
ncbi:carboxylesterase [Agrocybe pediades]|nr:carboxylesterase [Agrocybe pediades]